MSTVEAAPAGTEALLARAALLGGPHHLSRPRIAPPGPFDAAEAAAVVLTSVEARVAARDGLDVPPDRRGQVAAMMAIRAENPSATLDPGTNRAWTILEALIASLLGAESRLEKARVMPRPARPGADPLAELAAELAAGGEPPRDAGRFREAVGVLVARVMAVDAACDRPAAP